MRNGSGVPIWVIEMDDQKNLLLAIVLTGIVLIGWQYFFAVPQLEKQKQIAQQQQSQTQQPPPNPQPGTLPQAPGLSNAEPALTREARLRPRRAFASTPRA